MFVHVGLISLFSLLLRRIHFNAMFSLFWHGDNVNFESGRLDTLWRNQDRFLLLFEKRNRPWQDSNLQSPDPKSGALSIRPHGLTLTKEFTNQTWHSSVSKHVATFLSKTTCDVIERGYSTFTMLVCQRAFIKDNRALHDYWWYIQA